MKKFGVVDFVIKKIVYKGDNKGFTLVETLVAMLVVVLIAVGLTSGLRTATEVYLRSVFSSNSAILEDTINTELMNMLRYAQVNEEKSGLTSGENISFNIRFDNPKYELNTGNGFIEVDKGELYAYKGEDDDKPLALINKGSYGGYEISNFRLEFNKEANVFSVNYIIQANEGMVKEAGFRCKSIVNVV